MPIGHSVILALGAGAEIPRFLPGAPFNETSARLRAELNHCGQAPEELARRGGVSFCEALAILEDKPWRDASTHDELEALAKLRTLLPELP